MNDALIKILSTYPVQIGSFAFGWCLGAILVGVYAGMRMRGRILTEAAEGILATVQFQDAAKVQAEKAIRSVSFVEGVQRAVCEDKRTQSGIIGVVLTSAEIREMIDGRVKHGKTYHDYEIDARIRASQEATRREVIKLGERMEEKLDKFSDLLIDHIKGAAK